MAKRKRLTPATILEQGAASPALETKSGYPFGVAPTRAPIAQVAGDYSLRMPLVVGPRYLAESSGGSLSLAALAAIFFALMAQ